MNRLPALALALALPVALGLVVAPRTARAMRVHVRGSARLSAHVTPSVSSIVVAGNLRDETEAPIAGAEVTIAFLPTEATEATEGQGGPFPLPPAEACAPSARPARLTADRYAVTTGDQGDFCVRTSLSVAHAKMKLAYPGNALFDGTETELPVDRGETATSVRFDPAPRVLGLDEPTVSLGARLVSSVNLDPNAHAPSLLLLDERGHLLGAAAVDTEGSARFEVRTRDLAGPGMGELRLVFDGDGALPKAEAKQSVERHARVQLEIASPASGVPEEGINATVIVRSSAGEVDSGTIETRLRGIAIGAAPVVGGKADLVLTFAHSKADGAATDVDVLYIASEPWWEPGDAATLHLFLSERAPWRSSLFGLAALLVIAWAVRGWTRRKAPAADRTRPAAQPGRLGSPGIELVRPGTSREGWSGVILDAHEATVLPFAEVSLLAASFSGTPQVVASARADESGRFALRLPSGSGPLDDEPAPKLRLRAEAPGYSTLVRACPPPGEVAVALVTRRRQLLDLLVAWAKKAGGSLRGPLEPTPAQVVAAAGRAEQIDSPDTARPGIDRDALQGASPEAVRAWALAVEQAAFGPGAVSEEAEKAIVALEPRRPPGTGT